MEIDDARVDIQPGGEMAALCGCQSAHLAPLSPINRAYNRERRPLSRRRESFTTRGNQASGFWEGGEVSWMIASLCFPRSYLLPTKSSLCILCTLRLTRFPGETHRENGYRNKKWTLYKVDIRSISNSFENESELIELVNP